MKTYQLAGDETLDMAREIMEVHHEALFAAGVVLRILFVSDDAKPRDPVLFHAGYQAAAVVRIVPLRDRALRAGDAQVVIDLATWNEMSREQQVAVIDHELTHLEVVKDSASDGAQRDTCGRPKLRIRLHDHQFGWFDDVARRHGAASAEVRQARGFMRSSSVQLYFDFMEPPEPPPEPTMTITAEGHPPVTCTTEDLRRATSAMKRRRRERPAGEARP